MNARLAPLGFSVHNAVQFRADDAAGRIKVAQPKLRAPLSLEKMTYDRKTGPVITRVRALPRPHGYEPQRD